MGERGLALRGDILVKCYHRHRQSSKEGRETVFSLQFHTCAVTQHTLVFQRQDLDDACQGTYTNWADDFIKSSRRELNRIRCSGFSQLTSRTEC